MVADRAPDEPVLAPALGASPGVVLALAPSQLAIELAPAGEPGRVERTRPRSPRGPRSRARDRAGSRRTGSRSRARRCRRTSRRARRRRRPGRARASPACRGRARAPGSGRGAGGWSCGGRGRRPRGSPAVASTISPASALTSVDLPTPDEPMRAVVRPSASRSARVLEAEPGRGADRVDRGRRRRSARSRRPNPSTSSARSALFRTTIGSGARAPGEREVALEPPGVQVVVERGDDEQEVDVGGQDLLGRADRSAGARRTTAVRRGSRPWTSRWSGSPVAWSATQSPTTGKPAVALELGVEPEATGDGRPGLAGPAVRTRYEPRSSTTTRPGSWPSPAWPANAAAWPVVPAPVGERRPGGHRVTAGASTGPW